MSATRLAALLCSRLCHDLVSPLGALSNGIELLREDDDPEIRAQAVGLLEQCGVEALRRLTFFRLAFGMAGGMGDHLSVDEIRKAADGLFAQGRTRLDWRLPVDGASLPKERARILLNLVLVGSACLPRGGVLAVSSAEDGYQIAATGTGARLTDEAGTALRREVAIEKLDPQTAVPYLAASLLHDSGGTCVTHTKDGEVILRIGWR